jgi:hypothetical protein
MSARLTVRVALRWCSPSSQATHVTKALIEAGSNLNFAYNSAYRYGQEMSYPLIEAIRVINVKIVKNLLDAGSTTVGPYSKDSRGKRKLVHLRPPRGDTVLHE